MKRLSLTITLITLALSTLAVGPKIPCILTFSPSPDASVSGYWFYWRTPTGTYTNTQRWPMMTNSATGFDLRVIGLPNGTYYASCSATNLTWAESDLAPEIQWNYTKPHGPANLQILAP